MLLHSCSQLLHSYPEDDRGSRDADCRKFRIVPGLHFHTTDYPENGRLGCLPLHVVSCAAPLVRQRFGRLAHVHR